MTLRALQEKVLKATGGRLVYRGQEVSRRQLPGLIQRVSSEAETVRRDDVAARVPLTGALSAAYFAGAGRGPGR